MVLFKSKAVMALLLVGMALLTSAAPMETVSSDMVVCDEVMSNSTISSQCHVERAPQNHLQKRVTVGKAYYDNYGNVKMVITWAINKQLAASFEGSGFNLVKDVYNECRRWTLQNGSLRQAYLASYGDWSGQLDYKTSHLDGIINSYATIAVVVKTASTYAAETAEILSSWMAQGPDGVSVVDLGDTNAINYGFSNKKREIDPMETSPLKARSKDWCSAPVTGTFRAGSTSHTPRRLYYSTSC